MVFLSLELWRLKAQGRLLATRPLSSTYGPEEMEHRDWLCWVKGCGLMVGFWFFMMC